MFIVSSIFVCGGSLAATYCFVERRSWYGAHGFRFGRLNQNDGFDRPVALAADLPR
jgi:hypothetical protein